MEDDVFEAAANELEKSIQQEEKPGEEKDLSKAIADRLTSAVKDITALAKGKGGQTTDNEADKDKRGSLVDAGKDPAESPKKSGQGYKDSANYEARKGHGKDEDEDGDDDGDDGEGMPSFFKKKKHKKAKKVAKADDSDDESDDEDEVIDATDFVEEMGDAVDHLGKSVHRLEEGLACFGELLADLADPRKDKLVTTMAKAIGHLVMEQKEIKKALSQHNQLMKAIATMPGVPRVAGLQAIALDETNEAATSQGSGNNQISKSQRDRLFQLSVKKLVNPEDVKKAKSDGPEAVDKLIAQFKL